MSSLDRAVKGIEDPLVEMIIDRNASFAWFIYPFAFRSEVGQVNDELARRNEALEAAIWKSEDGTNEWSVWERDSLDVSDFYPHVRDFLCRPATSLVSDESALDGPVGSSKSRGPDQRGDRPHRHAHFWRMSDVPRQSPHGLGNGGKVRWYLAINDRSIHFKFEDIRLALFPEGIGFLLIRAEPISESVGDWQDFLHHFRFLAREHQVTVKAECGKWDKQARTTTFEPFLPEWAGGRSRAAEPTTLQHLVDGLLLTACGPKEPNVRPGTRGGPGCWWDEPFIANQTIPYAALYIDGESIADQPRRLYRIHNFFHEGQKLKAAESDLRTDQAALLPYAEGQWFVTSLDGTAFVAFDAPDTQFFRKDLPGHLNGPYFVLALLVLHQKFALMHLSRGVAEHGRQILLDTSLSTAAPGTALATLSRLDERFAQLRSALLSFTASAEFVQVGQRDHHHRFYQRLREIMQINELAHEVRNEVHDIHEFLRLKHAQHARAEMDKKKDHDEKQRLKEDRDQRRFEQLIAALALALGVPGLLFSAAEVAALTFDAGPQWVLALSLALAGLAVGGVLYWGLERWLARRRQARDRDLAVVGRDPA